MNAFPIPGFTDPVSSLSHLGAVFLVLAGARPLFARAGHHWGRRIALAAFVFGCVFTLSMSGVYHMLPDGTTGRYVMQQLDHAAIFTLIAGTFTPIHAAVFRRWWRWGMLAVIWGIAVTAISVTTVFFDNMPEWGALLLYLGMGWIGACSGTALWRHFGFAFIRPLLWGALAYTVGAVVDYLRFPTLIPGVIGPHELFHFAVLAGIAWHWRFIANIADGQTVYMPAALESQDNAQPEAA